MSTRVKVPAHTSDRVGEPGSTARRPYSPPQGVVLGRIYELALGTSPGVGDSLDPFTLEGGGMPQPGPAPPGRPPRR
jgi:hypothetical protein